jgi:hypothetical protein
MDELSSEDRAMLAAYVEAARAGWEDAGQMDRFEREPRAVLAEHGWSAPEGVELICEVTEAQGDQPGRSAGVEEIVGYWKRGIEAGEVRFTVPRNPVEFEPEPISDEDLAEASGGICSSCPDSAICAYSRCETRG